MTRNEDRAELERTESIESGHASAKSGVSSAPSGSHFGSTDQQEEEEKFKWKSQWQNIMFYLAYTTSYSTFINLRVHNIVHNDTNSSNIVQILLAYIFFGCPTMFIQIFIGQFTRRGCLIIGEMLPVANGLGIFLLLNTLLDFVMNMHLSVLLLYYSFVALLNQPTPAWMGCYDEYYDVSPNCLGLEAIDQCISCTNPSASSYDSCFDQDIHNFSADLFFAFNALEINSVTEDERLDFPTTKYLFHLTLSILLIFVAIMKSPRELDGAIRMWNLFSVTSITVMTAVVIFASMRINGVLYLLNLSEQSFVLPGTWTYSLHYVTMSLKLSEAGNFLFGSFTPATVNTAARCAYLCLGHFFVIIGVNLFLYLLVENLACALNTEMSSFATSTSNSDILVVYPQAIGLLAAAPLWGTLYFFILFGVTIQSAILQVIIIESTLSDAVINATYYLYTRVLVLIVSGICCAILGVPRVENLLVPILSIMTQYRLAAVFFFYCLLFIYGFQRLFDDIHFMLRAPPSFYFRLSWYVSLIMSGGAFIHVIWTEKNVNTREYNLLTYIVLVIVFFLGFLIKFIKYLRVKDLVSLFRQAATWGPVDSEAKANRSLFNPRYEVRYRRKVEKCKHRCLLNSSVLKKTLQKELALVSNVLLEIEDSEEISEQKTRVVENLRLHREAMSKYLAERAPEDTAFFHKKLLKS